MEANIYGCGGKGSWQKVAFGFLVITGIAHDGALAFGADFWTAKFLTSDLQKNSVESAPAYDAAGNIVAAWERVEDGALPVVRLASSADSGSSWNFRNIRAAAAPAGVSDRSPIVVTDKGGRWLCVWSSDDSLSGSAGSDYDIMFSGSVDSGASWSTPQLLNSTGLLDTGSDVEPWVSMDESGNCVVAWTSDNGITNVSGTTTTHTAIWMSRSSNSGESWTPAEAVAVAEGQSSSEVRLAATIPGSFGVVWTTRTENQSTGTVRFSSSDNAGSTWTAPLILNGSTGSAIPEGQTFNPAIAGDSSGKWMIAWNSPAPVSEFSTKTLAYIARTENNGVTWLPVTNADTASQGGDSYLPSLYTDDNGVWCIGSHNPLGVGRVHISRNFGASWSTAPSFPSTKVTFPSGIPEPPETTPFVWMKNAGGWNALFGKASTRTDPAFPNGRYDVRFASSVIPTTAPVNEEWSAAESLAPGGVVYRTNPRIAAGAGNTWVVVYSTGGGAGGDTEIGFVRSSNGGSDWSVPQILNSDWASDSAADSTPVIAASEGSVWLCSWARSDGKIWTSRSTDAGQTWLPPQPVALPGGSQLSGIDPGISSLGGGRWLLVWSGDSVYSSHSFNDGQSWNAPVRVQGTHTLGFCGNTSPCSTHQISRPSAFSVPGSLTAFVGFDHLETDRPSGYSGTSYSYERTDGHRSPDGGATYPDNDRYNYYVRPGYKGEREMAGDKNGNWISARRGRSIPGNWSVFFGKSKDDGNSFAYTPAPAVEGQENLWGKVAMDDACHWLRLWAGQQAVVMGETEASIYVSMSTDWGVTWPAATALDTSTLNGGDGPADVQVAGGASGTFVAVWQAGDGSLWYSTHREFYTPVSAVKDWQLFQ